jgi:RimJ/RimL family protein N-acetyltransferase
LIIPTDRLRLRPVEPKDIDDFVRYLNDWEVQQWLTQPPFPYERKDGEAYLAIVAANHATDHPTAFVIAGKASDAALGAVSVDIDEQGTGELGYWLGRDHWGRGIMKEAVGALLRHALGHPALRRLVAVTDPENVRSQHVLSACGLSDCGVKDRREPSRRGSSQVRRYELVVERGMR